MPTPSAVSYSTIAPANPPLAEATMTASEVAMNRAFPTPQPARNPMISLIEPEDPARAAKATIRMSPQISVHLAPMRLDTQLVISIATAVTTRYEVNSSVVSLGEACSWFEIAGRIGSTRPMPMKDTTQANATANTAFGCLNGLAVEPGRAPLIGELCSVLEFARCRDARREVRRAPAARRGARRPGRPVPAPPRRARPGTPG